VVQHLKHLGPGFNPQYLKRKGKGKRRRGRGEEGREKEGS
jgi:hypothetical protein